MARLLAALSIVIFAALAACTQGAQDDVAAIEAIDNAVGELDEAFESKDVVATKALMTTDHLAVTPYYGAPQSVDEVIASLPRYDIAQTDLSEPNVAFLAPDTAMRTLTAKLDGAFEGQAFSGKVFITSILVRRDGKWLERFYQVTTLGP